MRTSLPIIMGKLFGIILWLIDHVYIYIKNKYVFQDLFHIPGLQLSWGRSKVQPRYPTQTLEDWVWEGGIRLSRESWVLGLIWRMINISLSRATYYNNNKDSPSLRLIDIKIKRQGHTIIRTNQMNWVFDTNSDFLILI